MADTRAAALLDILNLETIDRDLYRGRNEDRGPMRLFGGQVLAQALRAACATIDAERMPHSLHAYFLRPGDVALPVLYEVDRIRDGRSFTTRRVVAVQNGQAILNLSLSAQVSEAGLEHEMPMPNVPLPEELENDRERALRLPPDDPRLSPMARRERPFEMRSVVDAWSAESRLFNPVWIRFPLPLDASDPALPFALLAYASDMGLVSTSTLPHASVTPRNQLQLASLDHTLWIHRPPDFSDWLLFARRTSTASGALGLNHAEFFDRSGTLLASVTQEGLLRPRRVEA